ncbi:C-type lectin domain family 4 member C-like [Mytilus galloprovincialis]|uniref:C-type lectin domain family 4 member C-like n=1 Tax=Mytilus galloprovincialis TaxID=29158 RepID=UPI003F7BCC1F
MFNCWYVIVIALSICHEVNTEEKFTRACTASQGRCAKTKDSNCESSFGSGWTEKGRCCRKRPCCVFQCEDIPTNRFANGTVIVAERNVGSTAKFTCDAGLFLVGRENITCTTSGWDGNIPQCAKILCPETVAFFRGSKYIFTCNLATWSNSKANCNVHGGHLTSVETGDENAFLVDVVALMHKHIQQILYAFFWIGLTDNNDEMSYKWLSGEPLNYSDWYQGSPQQPDNKNMQNKQGAHCAMIHPFYSLKWGDEFCSVLAYSVCEIRLT